MFAVPSSFIEIFQQTIFGHFQGGCLAGCVTNSCLMTPVYARRAFAYARLGEDLSDSHVLTLILTGNYLKTGRGCIYNYLFCGRKNDNGKQSKFYRAFTVRSITSLALLRTVMESPCACLSACLCVCVCYLLLVLIPQTLWRRLCCLMS